MDKQLISIIVPVYNVEQYVKRCLDSIVRQTYRNLEIIVIDDGSIDRSGNICEEYKSDKRVRVFHTENRGLACARNFGLDQAQGEWIGFVDADDWIEPDMYEVLLKRAEETAADVIECGVYKEFPGITEERKRENKEVAGMDAVQMLLRSELSNDVWSKLWRHSCFIATRFPEKRVYEDLATTFKIFVDVGCVCTIADSKYHYLIREGSLSKTHNMENLVGYWQSSKERSDFLWDRMDDTGRKLLVRWCALAVARTWAYYSDSSVEEIKKYQRILLDMNVYSKKYIRPFGDKGWGLKLRVGSLFPHYHSAFSFKLAWFVNRISLCAFN